MGLTVVDLFCGAGGLSQGFRNAGYSIVAGVDFDPDACATFQTNFPEAETVYGDLTDETVKSQVRSLAEGADVIVGGPPCQAFSQVRNHDRILNDPRNSLYKEFVGILREVKPAAFLMENVPGMAQMRVQKQVAEDLSLEGEYEVLAQLVDACDFGVPQTRERILFLAIHKSLMISPRLPAGSGASAAVNLRRDVSGRCVKYRVRSADLRGEQLQRLLGDPLDLTLVSAEDAISDLRFLQAGNRKDQLPATSLPAPTSAYQTLMRQRLKGTISNVSVPRINADTVLRLSAIPHGGNFRDLPEDLNKRYLTGQKWGPHNGSGRLGRKHFYAYRRLHPSIWAWTLNTKADSVYHWSQERALSVREFARLQSFSDDFVVTTDSRKGVLPGRIDGGPAHSRYRQIGNAVPPLLAQAVASELYSTISSAVTQKKRASA